MRKKILAILLAVVMVAAMLPTAFAAPAVWYQTYTDTNAFGWTFQDDGSVVPATLEFEAAKMIYETASIDGGDPQYVSLYLVKPGSSVTSVDGAETTFSYEGVGANYLGDNKFDLDPWYVEVNWSGKTMTAEEFFAGGEDGDSFDALWVYDRENSFGYIIMLESLYDVTVPSAPEDPTEPAEPEEATEPEEPETNEPGITVNVTDPEALRLPETTFTLRGWDWSYDDDLYLYTITRSEETEDCTTVEAFYELPLGITLTFTTAYASNMYNTFFAWSDPDGDGVYDQWIWLSRDLDMSPFCSPSEPGPFTTEMYGTDFGLAAGGIVGNDAMIPIPATVQITSDYLTELFGANTLLAFFMRTGDESSIQYNFLLTGEQVDSVEPDPTEPETPFTDVPADEWYFDAVNWAVENDIALGNGDGTFTPYDICSHIQILTFLWRAAGQDEDTLQAPVETDPNVPQYQLAANWAYSNGMIDGGFDPDADCTRADAVMYIWQAFGRKDAPDGGFTDVDADADYAKAVNWAVANGITVGDDAELNTFNPTKVCDRGEIVTFLHRAYVEAVRMK